MKTLIPIILLFGLSFTLHAQKDSYNIGVLMEMMNPEVATIMEQAREQIKVVVGEDADIYFPPESTLFSDFDLQKAAQNYQQLLDNNTDIILAFGPLNNIVVSRQSSYPKPTILFGAVTRDLVNVDLEKNTSGIENFTYLIESQSYIDDLRTFKELTDFSKVGILVEEAIVDILPFAETFDQIFAEMDAEYTMISYKTVGDIKAGLSDVDAVYLAGGFFLTDAEVEDLAKTFIEKKLPSFTNTNIGDVQKGLLATNQGKDNIDQFLRRISLTVESYINGGKLSEMPVLIERSPHLTINFNTAELVGVPIKYSLITTTDFVGSFKNALSEKGYNLLSAIAQGLDKNLSYDIRQKDVALAGQDVSSARSNYLPFATLNGTATHVDPDLAELSFGQNPEFSTAGNVTVQQTVYAPAVSANIDIQKNLFDAEQANFNAAELDLIYDVASAYFTTLILKANAQIQLSNLYQTKTNLEIARQNYEAGQAGKSDILRFRSEMAQNMQTMIESVNQMEQSFIGLNQVLNNPLGMEIDVEDAEMNKGIFEQYNYDELAELLDDPRLREPFTEFLVEEALKNAPEMKSLAYNIEANDRSLRLYGKGRYLPTVALQGQYNQVFSRSGAGSEGFMGRDPLNSNYNIGANVSIPIFNQNLNNINQQTATIRQEQLNLNRASLEQGLSVNVRVNVLNLTNRLSNIQLSEVSENAAREALELTQVAYSSGSVNIIQLIDAQSNYLDAQLARTTAFYTYLLDALLLERSIGYFFLLHSDEENDQFRQRFLDFLNR
jgi:outer membrane protein